MNKIIIALILVAYALIANAQQTRIFSTKVFKPEIYIGANTGLNIFMGENYKNYMFTDPTKAIGTIQRVNIGYNITKTLGVRTILGYTSHNWMDDNTTRNFNATHASLDLTYNLSNKLAAYDLTRPVDFSLFAGAGISNSLKTDANSYFIHSGLQADYHFTPFLDLNLIGDMNFVNDNYNGYISDVPYDLFPTLSVGITYHFRKKLKCHYGY